MEENLNSTQNNDLMTEPTQTNETFEEYKKRKRNQKIAISVFLVIAFFIIVVGLVQLKNLLQVPFADVFLEDNGEVVVAEETDIYNQDTEALKKQDTDEDGINDFDELYIYETSAYLSDTDSDGVDDKTEIEQGQDPTCPIGKVCFIGDDSSAQVVDIGETTLMQIDPTALRQVLLESGVATEAQISQFSDEELMAIYEQVLVENPEAALQMQQGLAELDNQDLTATNLMTPDQIRETLLNQGVDQTDLDQITDEELVQYYKQALQETEQEINSNN